MVIDARKRFPIKVPKLSIREGLVEDVVRRAQLWEDARRANMPDLEKLKRQQKEKENEKFKTYLSASNCSSGNDYGKSSGQMGVLIDARGKFRPEL